MLARLAKLRASGHTARAALSALTGPLPVSRSQAIGASERIAAVTSLLSSLEHLTTPDQKRPGGLNDWALARYGHAHSGRPLRKLLDFVADERTSRTLHAARVAASAALLLPGDSRARGAANLFLGLSGALLYPTQRYGTDGSDQASNLVQTATGMARLAPSPAAQDALVWYVALQSNLSYVVSGWIKLLGKDWRTGSALTGVMRTRTYGHEKVWRLTRRHPRSARALAHGVLAMECLFPVLYLKGGLLTRPVIAAVAAFHVANGSVMGLGRFIPAFTAMHPMVAYTSTPRSLRWTATATSWPTTARSAGRARAPWPSSCTDSAPCPRTSAGTPRPSTPTDASGWPTAGPATGRADGTLRRRTTWANRWTTWSI